jgi:hypothetical protein
MAKTIEKHSEGVLDYYRHAISTVCLEWINTKIKALSRRAYGFRNSGNFMRPVLAIGEFSPAKLMGSSQPARPPYPAESGPRQSGASAPLPLCPYAAGKPRTA